MMQFGGGAGSSPERGGFGIPGEWPQKIAEELKN